MPRKSLRSGKESPATATSLTTAQHVFARVLGEALATRWAAESSPACVAKPTQETPTDAKKKLRCRKDS